MKSNILSLVKNTLKLKLFLLTKLPMAFLAGLKVVDANQNKVSVSVPYRYVNKNPFKSMYFAVLAMAAELPSGILAINASSSFEHKISTLVIDMKANFMKKAKSKIVFTCEDGAILKEAVEKCISYDAPETAIVKSIGKDDKGEIVAEFHFTWTFKKK